MASNFRTALVGLGVIAVCIAMATLKGHHLLMAFAGASLVCALRSWIMLRKPNTGKPDFGEPCQPRRRSAEYQKPGAKVYQFPNPSFSISDAKGS